MNNLFTWLARQLLGKQRGDAFLRDTFLGNLKNQVNAALFVYMSGPGQTNIEGAKSYILARLDTLIAKSIKIDPVLSAVILTVAHTWAANEIDGLIAKAYQDLVKTTNGG